MKGRSLEEWKEALLRQRILGNTYFLLEGCWWITWRDFSDFLVPTHNLPTPTPLLRDRNAGPYTSKIIT